MRNSRQKICLGLIVAFLLNSLGPIPMAQALDFRLPAPGVKVPLSPEFNPLLLKGIKVHPDNPFRFDFILDKGDSQLSNGALKDESSKLIKYFLASLTIPEKDLWVNLSPYEKDRIIPQSFGLTEMGRDLLVEDYMLKQITASLIYPEDGIGKKFWKRIYEVAEQKFGTTNIPINTFNKVWIVPEKAVIYENAKAGTAYVVESKLKVMLEQDYLSLQKHEGSSSQVQTQGKETNQLGSQIVREIVIPELTKEVNENKNFAQLQQVYNSLILATWYKKKIKDSILEQVYGDKNKIAGVNIDDPQEKQRIYERYLQAFKRGVFNYIKEDTLSVSGMPSKEQEILPRKYFSGGVDLHFDSAMNSLGETARKMFRPVLVFIGQIPAGEGNKLESSPSQVLVITKIDPAGLMPVTQLNESASIAIDAKKEGEKALEEFVQLRTNNYADANPEVLTEELTEELTQKFVELRKKFYPWVLERLDRLQVQNRPLRIKVVLNYESGGGQYGKMKLLLKGLLAIQKNIEFRVEFTFRNSFLRRSWNRRKFFITSHLLGNDMNLKMEQSFGFTSLKDEIPNLEFGDLDSFSSYPADVIIGIHTDTKEPRSKSFLINVLIRSHGQFTGLGILDENDLGGPLGTIILDPTLKEMREEEDRNDQTTQRVNHRQRWLKMNMTPQEISYLPPDVANGIWTFAHSSRLLTEVYDLVGLFRRNIGNEVFGQYCVGKQQIVIFSSELSEDDIHRYDIHRYNSAGVTVITNGKIYPPTIPEHVPITIVIKNLPNQSVRELIGFHTGTLKRSRNNKFWINFPLFITGNASWMEAISAGALWRHDNNDAGSPKSNDISKLIGHKLVADALERDTNHLSSTDLGKESMRLASQFISRSFLMREDDGIFYGDLEAWTIWAKEFSQLMYQGYNRLVDILGVAVYNAEHNLSGAENLEEYGGLGDGHKRNKSMITDTGGIDLTVAKNVLQTQNNNGKIKFHIDPAMLKKLQNAPGFVPVIISIQPMTDLIAFLLN